MRVKEGNKDQAIMNAAISVFAHHGFHKAKIHKVAELANVAIGSIYLYYKSKEDILVKIYDNVWKRLYAEASLIHKRTDANSSEKLDALFSAYFNTFETNPELAKVFVNEQDYLSERGKNSTTYYSMFFEVSEQIIKEGIKGGEIRSDVNVAALRVFILGGVRSVLREWAFNPGVASIQQYRETISSTIKRGIIIS